VYSGDIAARLQLIESSVAPVAATTAIAADPSSAPGQRVAAMVVQQLAGGQFDVLVGGRTLQLALPPQTEVGQQVQLRQAPGGRWMAADTAAPVLARVDEDLGGGQFKVAVGGAMAQLALPPQTEVGQTVQLRQTANGQWTVADPAAANAASTRTDMSQAGRLVDMLAQAAAKPASMPEDAAPVLASAPVPSADLAAALPRTLAMALANALTNSGVFYESHLQQWNAGSRSLASLAAEPQAQLETNAANPQPSAAATQNAATNTPAADTSAAAAMSANVQQAGVHPDAAPMIARQLNTLETGSVSWRGELWPGQNLHWEIARDDDTNDAPGNGARAGDGSPKWHTRLSVSFPHLGAVTANLQLQGNAVRVSLASADLATRQKLGAATPALGSALADAGLNMQALEFEHEPATQG
jgi:hypothetical protein